MLLLIGEMDQNKGLMKTKINTKFKPDFGRIAEKTPVNALQLNTQCTVQYIYYKNKQNKI